MPLPAALKAGNDEPLVDEGCCGNVLVFGVEKLKGVVRVEEAVELNCVGCWLVGCSCCWEDGLKLNGAGLGLKLVDCEVVPLEAADALAAPFVKENGGTELDGAAAVNELPPLPNG